MDRQHSDGVYRVNGEVAPGFEAVRRAFVDNFVARGELGAACAAYCDGLKVIDLWGGVRDEPSGAPWDETTMALVSSTTKGLTALAVALAHSRGYLDLDERVSRYWPEFGQNGKGPITVRQLMSHQAGLCALDTPPTYEDVQDLDRLASILARQRPSWQPGTRQGYHAVTFGWYAGELVRRVDPSHRSLGRFFADEISSPLGLDFYIGLPADVPDERLASIKEFGLREILAGARKMPPMVTLGFLSPRSLTKRAFATPIPKTADPRKRKREFLAVEGPGYNGVGTARAIARAYGSFATGGRELRLRQESLDALMSPSSPPTKGRVDLVTGLEMPFSLGCCKPFHGYEFGGGSSAFGMPGLGGSFGYADPESRSSFAYVPNRWFFRLHDDPRQIALWSAFHKCLVGMRRA